MRCPYCRARDTRVIDSRDLNSGDAIRRRRECVVCSKRFTTYERFEMASLMVVKKDGRREEWDPVKLRQKLRVALTKRPVGEKQIDELISGVESDLLSLGLPEVPSASIGEAVLKRLRDLDHVAYIRFASVYREFADVADLKRELEDLQQRREAFTQGSAQVVEELSRSIAALDREAEEAQRRADDCANARQSLEHYHRTLGSIRPQMWSRDQLRQELIRAQSQLGEAEEELNGISPLLTSIRGGKKVAKSASKNEPETQGFLYWFRAGLAFTLPVMIFAAVLGLFFLIFSGS